MKLIKGDGLGDGKPKGNLILIKNDTIVRFDVIFHDQEFWVYDSINEEMCIGFRDNDLQKALETCLNWNLEELRKSS